MFSILDLWKKSKEISRRALVDRLKPYIDYQHTPSAQFEAGHINNHYLQNSFSLPENAHVVFVQSISPLVLANTIDDVPDVVPRDLDEKVILATYSLEPPLSSPDDFSPYMLLCQDIYYEPSKNIVFIEAVRIREYLFSLIQAGKFKIDNPFGVRDCYRLGVLAPLITQDDRVCLVQRQSLGLYTVPDVLVISEDDRLNFEQRRQNLILQLAEEAVLKKVLDESIFGVRVSFDNPVIASISIREYLHGVSCASLEFVVPFKLHCDANRLYYLLAESQSPCLQEYTGSAAFPTIDPQLRQEVETEFLADRYYGSFLYEPVLLAASDLYRREYLSYGYSMPCYFPNSATTAYPLSLFPPKPQKALTWSQDIHRQQQGQSHDRDEPDEVSKLTDKLSRLTLKRRT